MLFCTKITGKRNVKGEPRWKTEVLIKAINQHKGLMTMFISQTKYIFYWGFVQTCRKTRWNIEFTASHICSGGRQNIFSWREKQKTNEHKQTLYDKTDKSKKKTVKLVSAGNYDDISIFTIWCVTVITINDSGSTSKPFNLCSLYYWLAR